MRISRYGVFVRVAEEGSFTAVAHELGYTQSAISQQVKSLEAELGCTLLERRRDGLRLTKDGSSLMPYIQEVSRAEDALSRRQGELQGLEGSEISVGTFTSVSRNVLPPLMKEFKEAWPGVHFVLRQGEYTSIAEWVRSGELDLGFTDVEDATSLGLEIQPLLADEMMAVVPHGHRLARRRTVSLADLAQEPLIVLDEGESSVALHAFEAAGIAPKVEYTVTDDYSILQMVREGLGVTLLYELMLSNYDAGLLTKRVKEHPKRSICLAWRSEETLPVASRRFADKVISACREAPYPFVAPRRQVAGANLDNIGHETHESV